MPKILNIRPGDQFGKLIVMEHLRTIPNKGKLYLTHCSCGRTREVLATILIKSARACLPCSNAKNASDPNNVALKDWAIAQAQGAETTIESRAIQKGMNVQALRSEVEQAVLSAITSGFHTRDTIARETGYSARDVGNALARLIAKDRLYTKSLDEDTRGFFINECNTSTKVEISIEHERLSRVTHGTDTQCLNSQMSRGSGSGDPFSRPTTTLWTLAGQVQYHGPDSRRIRP
jgi:hypothetical protein